MWKIKIPLKVRVFMWLMLKNSILKKDNLARRGWTRSKQCHLCGHDESVEHLVFQCSLARLIWQVVIFALYLGRPPDGATDLMTTWMYRFPRSQHKLLLSGSAAVCWTIWKTRNDAVLIVDS